MADICIFRNEKVLPKAFDFWDKLTDNQKSLLCANTVRAEYKKKTNVMGELRSVSESPGALYVRDGVLRAYLLSEDGREVTLYRIFPGEVCVLSQGCLIENINFDILVDAETDVEVFCIRSGAFASVVSESLYAENFALKVAASRLSDVIWTLEQILFMSFDKRLATFLVDEMARSGENTIKLTHEQIAKYMSSAREVVSRMLKYFSEEGIVSLTRGGVTVIDKDRLRKLTY